MKELLEKQYINTLWKLFNIYSRHYIDETWFKREELLCVLKYNKTMKTISIFPDFTINKPYILKIDDGETLATYLFFIENISTPLPEGLTLKENELIKKVHIYQNISNK